MRPSMRGGLRSPDMITRLSIDPRVTVRDGSELLAMPKTVRVAFFTSKAVRSFATAMAQAQNTGQPIIPVIIDSYGGDVYNLLAMVDIVKSCRVPVATVVLGKAMSSGAVLFTCGSDGLRFMGPNATLMIHDVSDKNARKKSEEVKADAREVDRLNRKIYSLMDKNCGLEPGYTWDLVQKRSRVDWFLSPKQAVQHGYASHVAVPTLETSVRVSTELRW